MSEEVKCDICGEMTKSMGTHRCDRCWELERRIKRDPVPAQKIMSSLLPVHFTGEEHKQRHIFLHKMLDELLADYLQHSDGGVNHPIYELIRWSASQTEQPSE